MNIIKNINYNTNFKCLTLECYILGKFKNLWVDKSVETICIVLLYNVAQYPFRKDK